MLLMAVGRDSTERLGTDSSVLGHRKKKKKKHGFNEQLVYKRDNMKPLPSVGEASGILSQRTEECMVYVPRPP